MDGLRWFNYEKLPSYPHLSTGEAAIWERFIAANPGRFDRVCYDVPVGDTRPNNEELQLEWEANKQYLGKYKIDVLATKGEETYVIELKKEATTKALGEVWLYEFLYKRDYMPNGIVKCAIITDVEMPNIREVCDPDNVEVLIA